MLSVEENQSFERHVLRCKHCQERIEDEVNSLLALRRAAQVHQGHVDDQLAPMRFAYAF